MDSIVYLVFRSMRQPLLTLLMVYTVAVLGMVLIPGQDASGNPWHMDFFHAFYFVSFMATTIGFGEIPHEFTDAQRMWVLLSLYATVIAWIYALGILLALVKADAFQMALTTNRFSRRVRKISEPFYLLTGYGAVGSELCRDLTDHHQHVVVVDKDPETISALTLHNLRADVPAFIGNAAEPDTLVRAGLKHPMCSGVVGLTSSNLVNLKIALTSKLLNPTKQVICRADSATIEANMESFGTDYVVDPFETFSTHLSMALQAPGLYLLRQWLSSLSHAPLTEPVYPPKHGKWILCGFGRFGKAVYEILVDEGIEVTVIEATPEKTGSPHTDTVTGRGTEAETLREADIENSVGIIAGTDNDVDNLSIIMTAKEINSDLFVILRQNKRSNQSIVDAISADIVMHPSHIIASRIRMLLVTPMLHHFMDLARKKDDDWACELVSRMIAISSDRVPDVWELSVDCNEAEAVCKAIESGTRVTVGDLASSPSEREEQLPMIALLIESEGEFILLPDAGRELKTWDRILWASSPAVRNRIDWTLQNPVVLEYILTGEVQPRSPLMRFFNGKKKIPAGLN
ncbi:potassium channel family protein [Solemya velum gill symbiont]|uniref:potassium channel family protein n=1 Tax=Solemya velum gill symbiont TaxID=2340 RepID=UPI000997C203|nr:potassium channel protein [Solemya velum gill symbiont]OOY49758.1 potassium transporter TrkA [Solemya velum gill symbiont]OOY54213.1 potassium transporter TrkA [Solemya velum gill symbiont]OOY54376.1 potassium transporter TrkA [Solemya velum gill symbiont]OOY58986.1 potassium transporter TrkA [Solemya velum gill symbiont]OOY59964.1 potassium transporter TrkA [Solemya velum gill symbiont]